MAEQSSHNEKDLERARQIEQANAQGEAPDSDDPILSELNTYKARKKKNFGDTDADRKEVWEHIRAATQSSQEKKAPVLRLVSSPVTRWAAAAVVLLGVALSIFYVRYAQQPVLVAEAGAAIQTVTLQDGSNVTLRPHSSLYETAYTDQKHTYELQGEGFFEVTSDPSRTFSVQTESGKVSVLGTRFNLSSWGDQLQVFLEEGKVQVEALEQDSALVLNPGESALIKNSRSIPELQNILPDEVMDWMSQQLIFEGRTAQQIAKELEQEFNISISLPADIASQQLTGQLSLESRDIAFSDLEIVLNGAFVQTGNQQFKFEVNE